MKAKMTSQKFHNIGKKKVSLMMVILPKQLLLRVIIPILWNFCEVIFFFLMLKFYEFTEEIFDDKKRKGRKKYFPQIINNIKV